MTTTEYYFEEVEDDDYAWDLYCGDVYIGVLEHFDDDTFLFTDDFGHQYPLDDEVIDEDEAKDAIIELFTDTTKH